MFFVYICIPGSLYFEVFVSRGIPMIGFSVTIPTVQLPREFVTSISNNHARCRQFLVQYDIQMFVAENCCESPRQAHTIIIQLDFLKYVHTPEYIKPGRSWKTYFLFFVVHRNSEKNRKRQGKRGKTSTPSRIKSPRRPYYTPYDTPVHFPPVLFVAFVYSPAATLLFRVE